MLATEGIVPLVRSAGPLARTVADAAALLHSLSGTIEFLARIEAGLRAAAAQVVPASVAVEGMGGFEGDL